ncbi:MAG: VanZ family protein [Coprobacillaceae bacterium]
MYLMTTYFNEAINIVFQISLLSIPIIFILRIMGISILRQISYLGLFCALYLILYATVLYSGLNFNTVIHNLNLQPFSWMNSSSGDHRLLGEVIPNIIMFIPLGFFLPQVFKSCRNPLISLFLILITTLSVETIQYYTGRAADIDDVILNVIGGLIGLIIYKIINILFSNITWWKTLTSQ